MRVRLSLESRDGRLWCLLHDRWWKECACPGDVSVNVPITREAIEATTPKPSAYADYIRSIWPEYERQRREEMDRPMFGNATPKADGIP